MRVATAADAAAIAELHLASQRIAYRGLVPDAALDPGGVAARTATWAAALATGWPVFLAEDGDRLVAFCSLEPTPDADDDARQVAHIGSLHARPERRGRGLGSVLLERATGWAREAGYRELTLHVLEGNVAARTFYERRGWRQDGWRGTYGDTGVAVVRYRSTIHTPSAPLPERDRGN